MFWKKAREKYKGINESDSDIIKYFKIMAAFQGSGYGGVAGFVQDLGHKYVSRFTAQGRILEIGFGLGRQALFFKGDPDDYYPTDINDKYINCKQWGRFKNACVADATQLSFEDDFFDTVVSIYNLEHIQHIENVLNEIKRVLKPDGRFIVALPCEGGLAWNIGRELTTRRHFIKSYQINYDKVIAFEHVHDLKFLKRVLEKKFGSPMKPRYYPFFVGSVNLNLIYCGVFVANKSL